MDRDRELIAHLDAKLEGFASHIDAQFEGIAHRFENLQAQMDRHFDKSREQNRHTHVLVEDLHSKIQILAEGHAAKDEKIDRRFDQAEVGRREGRDHLEGMMKAIFVILSRRDDQLEERLAAG